MKKIVLIALFSVFLFSLSACYGQNQKITAAVSDLQAQEGISQGVSNTLSDYLRTCLVNTDKFTMVTRENMQEILKEQDFQSTGCTSKECIVKMGQLLGVRRMFTGSIGRIGTTYLINLKIVNVESGKIEKAVTEECDKCEENALLGSIRNITSKAIEPSIPFVSSQPAKPKVAAPEKKEDTVYITRTGSKYHRYGCRYLSKSCIPIDRDNAINQGYGPCSVCRP